MINIIQRVLQARVEIEGGLHAEISRGLLVYSCIMPHDTITIATKMSKKVNNLRIFGNQEGKMDLSLLDIDGGILIIPNFTIAGNTKKGNRPNFSTGIDIFHAQDLFHRFVKESACLNSHTKSGIFGADMHIRSELDGPVNLILES